MVSRFYLARDFAPFEYTGEVFANHGNQSRVAFVAVAFGILGLQFDHVALHVLPFE